MCTESGTRHTSYQDSPVATAIRGASGGITANLVTHALRAEGADASEDGTGRGTPLVVVPYQCHGSNVGPMGTIRAGNGNETGGVPFVIAFQERGRTQGRTLEYQEDTAYSLNAPSGGGRRHENNIASNVVVRRLLPVECLRLMGLPDDWLDVDPPLSDSRKYHMIGNGGVTFIVEWIGRRILATMREGVGS